MRSMCHIQCNIIILCFSIGLFINKLCYSSSLDFIHNERVVTVDQELLDEKLTNNDPWQSTGRNDIKCGVWLAPSTIVGAGMGMFAGRDYDNEEEVLSSGDSVVPIVDYAHHTAVNSLSDMTFLWDEYTWNAQALLADGDGRFDTTIASPGYGAAANSFLPIYNVDEWYPLKDSSGLHRSRDPGAGSFSLYHNRKSTARHRIGEGQELFVSYGSEWFKSRSNLGPIPLDKDFDSVQKLISKYKLLQQKIGQTLSSFVWTDFVANTSFKESRVIGSFQHSDIDELHILTQTNTTIKELRIIQSTRSLPWLLQHGTCGDHLVVRPSTLMQAGRGAFAFRDLPSGTIVAQLPMIHIVNRSVLDMFNFESIENNGEVTYIPTISAGRLGSQMLLNYCYGHINSTLLLCPYGPLTNYINHNQTQANVKLRWGRRESGNHVPELLQQPIESFSENKTAKFAMELIALRDIEQDEEIFLDYGNEWEAAWQSHVLNWKPVPGADRYRSAADMNDHNSRLPTIFEQLGRRADPFPPNVELKCDASYNRLADVWKEHDAAGTLHHFLEFHEPDYQACIVLRYEIIDKRYFYYVHMFNIPGDEDEAGGVDGHQPKNNLIVGGMPREAFRFFDTPYTDDSFLPNAFRHDIRIPEDLFPPIWMNQ